MRQLGIPLLRLIFAAILGLSPGLAKAVCTVPNALTNGQTADASQVMADFDSILGCVNAPPTGSNGSGSVFDFTLMGAPSASQVLSFGVVTVPVTYPAGLPEVIAAVGTAPTSAVALSIEKNGSAIGSINWAAGANLATVAFSSPVSFVVGDTIGVVAPATVDATFANVTVQWVPIHNLVTASRAFNTTYTNTTGRRMTVSVQINVPSNPNINFIPTVNGVSLPIATAFSSMAYGYPFLVTFEVGPGQTYELVTDTISGSGPALGAWDEFY